MGVVEDRRCRKLDGRVVPPDLNLEMEETARAFDETMSSWTCIRSSFSTIEPMTSLFPIAVPNCGLLSAKIK